MSAAVDPSVRPAAGDPRLMAAMIAVSLAALLIPAFLVQDPPVTDYANHLTRMWLIAGGADDPALSPYYVVDWSQASTNIAVDLAARWIGPWLGIERLGPALLALSIALPPFAVVLLNRALFGDWHWWQVLFAAFGWTMTAVVGFLNFQLGLGVALLAAAADGVLSRRGWVVAAVGRLAVGAVLTLFHPFDVMFYAALVAGLSLSPDLPWRDAPGLARRLARAAAAALPTVAPLAVALLLAPAAPAIGNDVSPWIQWGDMGLDRLGLLKSAFLTYGPAFDLPTTGAVIVLAVLAVTRRRLERHQGLLLIAGVLVLLALVMPMKLGDTYYIDRRLPIMALLTFAAAVRPQLMLTARQAAAAGGVLLAVGLVRTGAVAGVWVARQPDAKSVRRVLAHVEPGSAILPLMHVPSASALAGLPAGRYVVTDPTAWHLATLAVAERRAFVSTLFTAAGKQPVRVTEAWRDVASPNAPVVSVRVLATPSERLPPDAHMLRAWRRFDFVLVLGADTPDRNGPMPAVTGVSLVADEGFARLYRIAS